MIPVSTEYKRQLIAGNRNWVIKIPVYLSDNTSMETPDFTLTNEEVWDQGVVVDQATSSDNSFEIGSAIVGSLKVVIDNITGHFSTYDFYNAKLVLYLGVEGDLDANDEQVYYRIGFYTVDEPSYNGSLITFNCLDNMTWFDLPFSEVTGASFPTTAGSLVAAICARVGVTLGTVSFPNYTTVIPVAPDAKLNCREVLQYVAQMCCCYCKINTAGELVLAWYDKYAIINLVNYDGGTFNTNTTPYSDGDDLDGGSFDPWSVGDSADGGSFADLQNGVYLSQNYQTEVSTDDIIVTGCRVRNSKKDEDEAYDELWVDSDIEAEHGRYVLVIEDNPFITKTNAGTIANQVGNILAGLPIRAYTATSLADFSYETGDMARVYDFRGNIYYSWITKFTFTTFNSEQFSCGAESVRKRNEERYSGVAKTLAEAEDNAKKLLTDYDRAVKAMNELAQNAIGYNKYQYNISGGTVTWLYNGSSIVTTDPEHPLFPNSTVVFKISGDGVFISNDGGETYTQGYDANSGTAILSLIYAIGINCDWIHAGTLTLGGTGADGYGVNGVCSVLNASNIEKVRLDNTGLTAAAGKITGNLTIGSNGQLGTFGSSTSMNAAVLKNGSIGISANRGSSWCGLTFGKESASKTGWSNACCVLWNGGDSGGGFHVISGSPNQGDTGNFSALKHSVMQFWEYSNLVYYYDAGGGHSGSDRRLKYDITPFDTESIRTFFSVVNPVSFRFKRNDSKQFGIIAQELEEALKTANLTNDVIVEENDDINRYKNVAYSEFHGLELAAIKDLYEIVNSQKEEIDSLKSELAELKARLN